ncbi:MAG: hypothetical protein ABIH00_12035, partial [Armatimonadota bacterium]
MGLYDWLNNAVNLVKIVESSSAKREMTFDIIDERNFDKYINSDIGTKFLAYLKKKDLTLWKIIVDNQRKLKGIKGKEAAYLKNKKATLLKLFNEYHAKNSNYNSYVTVSNCPKILKSSLGYNFLRILKRDYPVLHKGFMQKGYDGIQDNTKVFFAHLFNRYFKSGCNKIELGHRSEYIKKMVFWAKGKHIHSAKKKVYSKPVNENTDPVRYDPDYLNLLLSSSSGYNFLQKLKVSCSKLHRVYIQQNEPKLTNLKKFDKKAYGLLAGLYGRYLNSGKVPKTAYRTPQEEEQRISSFVRKNLKTPEDITKCIEKIEKLPAEDAFIAKKVFKDIFFKKSLMSKNPDYVRRYLEFVKLYLAEFFTSGSPDYAGLIKEGKDVLGDLYYFTDYITGKMDERYILAGLKDRYNI